MKWPVGERFTEAVVWRFHIFKTEQNHDRTVFLEFYGARLISKLMDAKVRFNYVAEQPRTIYNLPRRIRGRLKATANDTAMIYIYIYIIYTIWIRVVNSPILQYHRPQDYLNILVNIIHHIWKEFLTKHKLRLIHQISRIYALAGIFLRSLMVCSYRTSLKANKNAAVRTLCVTLGPIPKFVNDEFEYVKYWAYLCKTQRNLPLWWSSSCHQACSLSESLAQQCAFDSLQWCTGMWYL